MSIVHHPRLIRRADGRWEIKCGECATFEEIIPVGIGLPIRDRQDAERIRDNHVRRTRSAA